MPSGNMRLLMTARPAHAPGPTSTKKAADTEADAHEEGGGPGGRRARCAAAGTVADAPYARRRARTVADAPYVRRRG